MALDLRTWKAVYNLFNPTARLEVGDQDLFVSRPGSVTDAIAGDLRAGLEPDAKWVVCGSMGSGKSSELVHLATELRNSHGVIALDLPNSVARIESIQPAEVLFLIGAAALRTLAESPGGNPDQAAEKELVRAFHGLLAEDATSVNIPDILKGVALFAANLAAPGASAVVGAASGAAQVAAGAVGNRKLAPRRAGQLGGRTRPVKDGEPDLERLREAVDGILKAFGAYKPPVVLVDGLDKIQDIQSIRGLFSATRVLSEPRAPVVYSGPITLMLNTEWQAAGGAFKRERLTNVVVHEPGLSWHAVPGSKIEQGRQTMRQVVETRLAREHLQLDDVFAAGCLDLLVEASGGLMRDLLHLVNRAVRQSIFRETGIIDDDSARIAIEDIRKEYEITLNTKRVDELRHVRKSGEPSGADVSIELLLNGYVLPYSNGRVWFAPHPILRGLRDGL